MLHPRPIPRPIPRPSQFARLGRRAPALAVVVATLLTSAVPLTGCNACGARATQQAARGPGGLAVSGTPAAAVGTAASGAVDAALVLGAPAGVIAAYTGINTGPSPNKAGTFNLTPLYAERGLRLIRTHDFNGAFDLVDVSSATPFALTDVEAAAIRAGGFQMYLRLGSSWQTSDGPQDPDTLVDAMVRMLKHVNAGDPAHPVGYVEIWNEPDAVRFWRGTPEEFAQFYVKAARAIRAVDPRVRIGGPAFSSPCVVIPKSKAFVTTFLSEVRKSGAPFDFLSWHLYANDPAAYAYAAKEYRKSLEAAGFGDIEQIVSEWNTSYEGEDGAAGDAALPGGGRPAAPGARAGAGGDRAGAPGGAGGRPGGPPGGAGGAGGGARPRGGAEALAGGVDSSTWRAHRTELGVRTGAQASALTTGAWIAMQQNGVDQEFFYRGPDPLPYPSGRFGMFYSDGASKPAGLAALLWKQLMDHSTLRPLSGPASGPLWALAGQDARGETALLLANSGDTALTWSLAGAGAVTSARVTRLRGAATALEESTIQALVYTLDPHETALVKFSSSGG